MLWLETLRCLIRNRKSLSKTGAFAWTFLFFATVVLLQQGIHGDVRGLIHFVLTTAIFFLFLFLLTRSDPISKTVALNPDKYRSILKESLYAALISLPAIVIGNGLVNIFFIFAKLGYEPTSLGLAAHALMTGLQLVGTLIFLVSLGYVALRIGQFGVLIANDINPSNSLNHGRWWRLLGNYIVLLLIVESPFFFFTWFAGSVNSYVGNRGTFQASMLFQWLFLALESGLQIIKCATFAAFVFMSTRIFYQESETTPRRTNNA